MKTICAWCGKHLKGDPADPLVSHGICPECAEKLHPPGPRLRIGQKG